MRDTLKNKKVTLGLLTVALVFAVIVVSSFWPFILDPTRIMTNEFLTDELIITAIVLSVTVSMLFVAQASNAADPKSEIAKAKVAFKASIDRIANHTGFYQWVKKILQARDRKEIAEREMAKLLIPYRVYEMGEAEILALVKPAKVGDAYLGPYPLASLKRVVELKKAVSKVRFVAPNYYTSVNSIQSEKTLSELAKSENTKKIMTVVLQLALRVLITWVGASILGSLVRDMAQDGGSSAQAWMRFLSRAFAFGSSCFLGFAMGCKLNDLDAFYISKRIETHTLYLEDKSFVPEDESKIAYEKEAAENG